VCGKEQQSIYTSLFDFQFSWTNATFEAFQKIQSTEIGVCHTGPGAFLR
jgi:hypothetical protein